MIPPTESDRATSAVYLGLFLLSAAMLAFEVVLIRLFALAQGHHFAFMAVSLALLGGGASGTFLSLRPVLPHSGHRWLSLSALFFTLSVPASYLLVNVLPFDMYRIAWEANQLLWLVLYYLALTTPFFFTGLAVGAALVAWPRKANRLYAANLLGSGLGPPLALLALATVGGSGTVFAVALLGGLAFVALAWGAKGHGRLLWARPLSLLLCAVCAALFLLPPGAADIRLTPYHALSQALLYPGSRIVSQVWNAFSRVDIVASKGIRSAPGLSMAAPAGPPPQRGLTVDAQNLSPITLVPPSEADFVDYLPITLAYQLRPHADVLIVEPEGGLAVLAALRSGARSVTVVHSNPAVAGAVARWGAGLYDDPRVTVVVDEPRSYLRREDRRFDLVVVPVTDSFRPITAGAYALGEDYRYTVESFGEFWRHLSPDGLLVAERWLQLPPSESLRLWGILVEAASRSGVNDPGAHLLALRSLQTSLVFGSPTPVPDDDLNRVREFAASHQYDLLWMPDLPQSVVALPALSQEGGPPVPDEQLGALGINHTNVVAGAPYFHAFARLVTTPDRPAFYAHYEYAVAPPTDDHPFFFHFFKWRQTPQILASLGKMWLPFGGSGYLLLVLLLLLVLGLSAGLILLPLAVTGRHQMSDRESQIPDHRKTPTLRYLLYFSMLGLGFLMVEIPLLQRFIVYLGQPAYAFATVVGALLVASGVGSRYLAERVPRMLGLAALAGLALIYPVLLSPLFQATFGLPFAGRVMVSVLVLAPIGLLMGLPFPQGLALARRHAPHLLPWIWAVNGCASVVSAVLAPMLAIDLGFRAVMLVGAGAYLVALLPFSSQQSVVSGQQSAVTS